MPELRDRLQATLEGTYALQRELGGGGMSRVFLAEELRLGRRVVVKVLSPEMAAGISAERFEREIRMAASLQQANIVPLLSAGDTNGLPYYTMPFVEGESLRARLAAGPQLALADVVRILGDVARALAYAHASGVVHRDVKPDNVLLSGGTAVVTDFGIAKALSASRLGQDGGSAGATLTQAGTSIGTPAYMAPEQAAGDPAVDHRADIYALGCLAYELLAGHAPFHGRSPQRILVAQLSEEPAPLAGLRPDVPAALTDLVMRCLAKDPAGRPQSADEVVAALNDVASGSGAARAATTTGGREHTRGRWRRATRVGTVASLVVVLAAAALGLHAYGWLPTSSLVSSGRLEEHDRLLIADFGVRDADSSVAHVVAEGVRVALGQSPTIRLVDATEVAAVLVRMQRPANARVDLELARAIAAREGVKAIVDGDVTALGQGFAISLRLVSADSGTVLARDQATAAGPSELVDTIDEMTRRLRGRIGESLRSVNASPPLARVTTPSYDALGLYTQASRLADIELAQAEAIPLLRQAVAIDTGFAMAWRKLGAVMWNLYHPPSAVDSVLERAFMLRDRLPERERYMTEGTYYYLGRGRDRAKSIAAYEALLRRGDSAASVRINLASRYTSRREFARAESLLMAEVRARPDGALAKGNLVNLLLWQGRLAEADSLNDEILRRLPNDGQAAVVHVGRPYRARRYEEYLRAVDSLRADAATPRVRLAATHEAGAAALITGRLGEFHRLRREEDDLGAALGTPRTPAILDSNQVARVEAWFRGEGDRAARRLDAALAAHPLETLAESDRPYLALATTYAMAGRPDRAREMLARRRRELRDTSLVRWQEPREQRVLGEIALAEGRARDALEAFERGDRWPDGPASQHPSEMHFGAGRAYDMLGMADSAIAAFERYLAWPSFSRTELDGYAVAGIHRRLGELHEARGEWEKAAAHYTAFVTLWKDADAELQPAVARVRERLARGSDVAGR